MAHKKTLNIKIKRMKKLLLLAALFSMIVGAQSCFTNKKVERIDPKEVRDLSGRWNDTDSRLVAEQLTAQALSERWLPEYQTGTGKRPVVIVGLVQNKSHEHINSETFIKDVEREFIKSGRVRLVQAGEKREELRRERAEQKDFASPETQKKWGRELGADFIMQGTINSIIDSHNREKVVFYQINLELTNIETNEIVWIGEKKIKKYITN